MPRQQLKLHLEREAEILRLWNPATKSHLPTPEEAKEQAQQRAEDEAEARKRAEGENARLRRLLERAGLRPDDAP